MIELVGMRSVLDAERDTLRAEIGEITGTPRDPTGSVFGKRVGQGTSQSVERITQVDAAKHLDAKLRDVERALEKLDGGTYGVCDVGGEPIGRERLEAIGGHVRCIEHARLCP